MNIQYIMKQDTQVSKDIRIKYHWRKTSVQEKSTRKKTAADFLVQQLFPTKHHLPAIIGTSKPVHIWFSRPIIHKQRRP